VAYTDTPLESLTGAQADLRADSRTTKLCRARLADEKILMVDSPRNRGGSRRAPPRPKAGQGPGSIIESLVSRASPQVLSDGGAVYTRYIIGPSVQAWETRKASCPLQFSPSMWRKRFRNTSAANSRWASVVSVDGHIFVHPWRAQRPARFHFDHSTTARKGIHRNDSFLPPVGDDGAPSLIFATILIVRLSPVSSQSANPSGPPAQCTRLIGTSYTRVPSLLLIGRLWEIRSLNTLGLTTCCLQYALSHPNPCWVLAS
jgi:hypothetical protein